MNFEGCKRKFDVERYTFKYKKMAKELASPSTSSSKSGSSSSGKVNDQKPNAAKSKKDL